MMPRPKGSNARRPKAASEAASYSRREADPWQMGLVGLGVCDPVTMEVTQRAAVHVPSEIPDAGCSGRGFHVTRALFPSTGLRDPLRKALRGNPDEGERDPWAGNVCTPFTPDERHEIAVKRTDVWGIEALGVQAWEERR